MAGCGIGTGPTQELTIDEPLGSAAVTDVTVSMGAGKLTIQPGAARAGVGRHPLQRGGLEAQRHPDRLLAHHQAGEHQRDCRVWARDIVNEWDLKLGRTPMRLAVTAGAYEGTYEFGDLSLQRLSIKDGASKSQVSFSTPNPSQMESLSYETGASSVTLTGLADANFKKHGVQRRGRLVHPRFLGDSAERRVCQHPGGRRQRPHHRPVHHGGPSGRQGQSDQRHLRGRLAGAGQDLPHTRGGSQTQGKLLTITVNMSVGSLSLTTSE